MALLTGTEQSYYEGNDYGNYQFVSIRDIISQFMVAYVGEEKIISKAKRTDVAFHAQRALAEEFSAYQNFIQANRGKFANKYEFKKAYDDSRKDVREARLKAINEGGDGNLRTLSDNDLEEARQIQAQYGTGDPNE